MAETEETVYSTEVDVNLFFNSRKASHTGDPFVHLHSVSKNTSSAPAAEDADLEDASSPLHSLVERVMTCCFPFSLLTVVYFSGAHLAQLDFAWTLLLAIPLGWVMGDFVTGMVHWAADTYGSVNTFVLGPNFVKPFRLHHRHPQAICAHDIFVTIGNTCILAVPLMTICLYFLWADQVSLLLAFFTSVMAFMTATTVATNLFHKWAHADSPPQIIILLQRANLVLRPEHHAAHHAHPHHNSYCITNGWCNPLLDRIKFFRGLEYALAVVRILPSREAR